MNKRCSQEWPDRSCTAWLARRIRNRLLPLLAALIVALAVFPVPAIAEGTTVRVGANADFGISVNGTNATGFAADYFREIGKRTGDTYQYVSATEPELAKKLAAGEVDIIPCVTEQELSSWKSLMAEQGYDGELYLSSFSLMTKFSAVYVHKDSSVTYSDLESLRTKRIGYLAEDQGMFFPNGEFLTPGLRQAEFVAYNTEEQMHSDFNSGKIDAVAKCCFRSWSDDVIVCQMSTAECYFMGTENSKDILDELDEAVGGIMMSDSSFSSNMYEKYVSRFGGQRYAYTESEKYYVTNNKKLTIGVNIQSSMLDQVDGNTVTGALAETMNQLGEIAGMEIRLVPYDSIKGLRFRNEGGRSTGDMRRSELRFCGAVLRDQGVCAIFQNAGCRGREGRGFHQRTLKDCNSDLRRGYQCIPFHRVPECAAGSIQ